MTKEEMFEKCRKELPPLIGRSAISKLFPGILTPATLEKLDAQGNGPDGRVRMRRKIVYDRDKLLDWLQGDTVCLKKM